MHKRIIRGLIKLFGTPTRATMINDGFLINWRLFNYCTISYYLIVFIEGSGPPSICHQVHLHNFVPLGRASMGYLFLSHLP